MKELPLTGWNEFQERVRSLTPAGKSDQALAPQYLFRGHADASWSLSTTLERYIGRDMSVADYYRSIYRAKPEIAAHTGREWKLPSPQEYEEWLSAQDVLPFGEFPAYEYMIFLRHHGFPSPLLDWTNSPYIAAFFAFSDASLFESDRVSVYVFDAARTGAFWKGSPHAGVLGPYVTGHARHFRQQSWYTICTTWVEGVRVPWFFFNHDHAFSQMREGHIEKLTMPAAKRNDVLEHLDQYNLNAYSLFGSEDSLMQTMAFRVFK